MAKTTFVADSTFPGQSAVELFRLAASSIGGRSTRYDRDGQRRDFRLSRDMRGLDQHILRDLGIDRSAC